MRKLFVLIGLAGLLTACGDQKTMPFLGQWDGGFDVEKVLKGPDSETDRKRHRLKGYIKIVLNKKKYDMHLEGEQQTIDVTGKWSYNGRQLILEPTDVKFDDEGKAAGVDPNQKFIASEELYSAYLKKLTFKISEDGKKLDGLTTTIAILEGTHRFIKE